MGEGRGAVACGPPLCPCEEGQGGAEVVRFKEFSSALDCAAEEARLKMGAGPSVRCQQRRGELEGPEVNLDNCHVRCAG